MNDVADDAGIDRDIALLANAWVSSPNRLQALEQSRCVLSLSSQLGMRPVDLRRDDLLDDAVDVMRELPSGSNLTSVFQTVTSGLETSGLETSGMDAEQASPSQNLKRSVFAAILYALGEHLAYKARTHELPADERNLRRQVRDNWNKLFTTVE